MEPRPELLTPCVVTAYATRVRDAILAGPGQAWKNADTNKAVVQLAKALTAEHDAFGRALYLLSEFKWIISQDVVDLLHDRTKFHAAALCEAEQEWVVKNGVRSPVKEGDRVRFTAEASNVDMFGKIEAVLRDRGKCVIRIDNSGDPSGENPETLTEKAEKGAAVQLVVVPVERIDCVYTGKSKVVPILSVSRVCA